MKVKSQERRERIKYKIKYKINFNINNLYRNKNPIIHNINMFLCKYIIYFVLHIFFIYYLMASKDVKQTLNEKKNKTNDI